MSLHLSPVPMLMRYLFTCRTTAYVETSMNARKHIEIQYSHDKQLKQVGTVRNSLFHGIQCC